MNRPHLAILLITFLTQVCTFANVTFTRAETAHGIAREIKFLRTSDLPSWERSQYKERFRTLRDREFLEYEGKKRRIPWLFVRDGCHMRATHFNEEADRLGYIKPKKIFIFGELEMKGNIIPNGSVEPWFHAAPIINVEGEPIILDPSVNFSGPLTLSTWIERIVKKNGKVIFSICDTDAYLPTSKCYNPPPLDRALLERETELFLKFESNILNYLGLEFKEE